MDKGEKSVINKEEEEEKGEIRRRKREKESSCSGHCFCNPAHPWGFLPPCVLQVTGEEELDPNILGRPWDTFLGRVGYFQLVGLQG